MPEDQATCQADAMGIQDPGELPGAGDNSCSTQGATTSHFNQGVPACPLCFIPSSSAPKL